MPRFSTAILLMSLAAMPSVAGAQTSTLAPAGSPGVTPSLKGPPAAATEPPAPGGSPGGTPALKAPPTTATEPPAPAGKAPSAAQAAQRERMTTCNAAAADRKFSGAARSSYMSACLAGKADPKAMMKVCNGQASQDKLSAGARRDYLSTCLKTSG